MTGVSVKKAIALVAAAALMVLSPVEAAQWTYFRLKSPTGQVPVDPTPPPPQSQISYVVSGPSAGTLGQSYAATSQVTGATGTLLFSIFSGALPAGVSLNPVTGAVFGVPTEAGTFSAALRAYDSGSATEALASLSLTVSPVFTLVGVASGVATVGSPYSAQLSGNGGATPYSFFTSSVLPPGLSLSAAGGALAGVPSQVGTYPNISISGQDATGRTASSPAFTMVVSNPLSIVWTAAAGRAGDAYTSTPSASGGHAPLFYVLNGALPSGLNFSGSTGTISGTPTVSGDFSVQIAVGDQDGRSAATSYETISIVPAHVEPPLAITGAPATSGQVDVAYSASFSATGGSGAGYAFDLAGNALPDGLTLNADGSISGSPTTAATYADIQVRVTDSEAHTALSNAFSIIVAPAPQLMISGNPSPSAQVGAAYSANFVAFEGSGAGYSFSSIGAALPPGLTLTQVTQAQADLSGTPSYVGTYSALQIRVVDSKGHVADSNPFSITVAAPAGAPLAVSGTPQTWADIGVSYSAKLTASGGTHQGYAFSLLSGALPAGLSLDADGTISGTPSAAGSSSFQVQVVDSAGDTATGRYSISAVEPLAVSVDVSVGEVGIAYSAPLDASGGDGNYAFQIVGSLPPGLTLSGATISGQPSQSGTYSFTVEVVDGTGNSITSNPVSIVIYDTLILNLIGVGSTQVGQPFFIQARTAGGNGGATSFSVTGNPAWLAFEPVSGALSGTPSFADAGPVEISETVSQVGGGNSTTTFSFNVVASPITISSAVLPAGVVGTAYSSSLDVAGGTGTYSSVVASNPSELAALGISVAIVNNKVTFGGRGAAPGTWSGTFTITDSSGQSKTSDSLRLTVDPVLVLTGTPAAGAVSEPYSFTPSVSGGSGTYSTYTQTTTSGSLSALGLTFTIATGTISGSPSATGTWTGTITVTDSTSATGTSAPFTITVGPGLAITANTTSITTAVNETWSGITTSATGGIGTKAYSEVDTTGTLAALGLALDPSNGSISGTPSTTGSWVGRVKVTDSGNSTGAQTASISITVNAALAINAAPPSGSVGTAYSYDLTTVTSGGAGSKTYSVANSVTGTLSGLGLSLSSAGIISGSAPVAGTWSGTIKVTDAGGGLATTSQLTIVVAAPVSFSSALLPNGTQGVGYSYNLSSITSGGRAPYGYSLTAGSLPMGLSLSNSGNGNANDVMSGTPAAVGTFTPTLRVVDADGRIASAQLSVTVSASVVGHGMTPVTTAYSGNDNSPSLTPAFDVAAGTMIVVDIARQGTGDVTSTTVTDNKGLTWTRRQAQAQFHSIPGAWYRVERWWAYSASAQTGVRVSFTFNRSGGFSSFTHSVVYGYTGVAKANGGNPWYDNGGANPVAASNVTTTSVSMSATVDPRGASKFISVATALYRDTASGVPGAGTGMSLLGASGENSGSGNTAIVSEEKLSNTSQGVVQADAFTLGETNWEMIADVIDGS